MMLQGHGARFFYHFIEAGEIMVREICFGFAKANNIKQYRPSTNGGAIF